MKPISQNSTTGHFLGYEMCQILDMVFGKTKFGEIREPHFAHHKLLKNEIIFLYTAGIPLLQEHSPVHQSEVFSLQQ